ncbi:hypothetical protein F5X96DRAFT_628094 [Biscogniauxia mediterranea]|nr:hypothetical protein F5X96DRAFT_628094 [Biscogniauxia mediterranea]
MSIPLLRRRGRPVPTIISPRLLRGRCCFCTGTATTSPHSASSAPPTADPYTHASPVALGQARLRHHDAGGGGIEPPRRGSDPLSPVDRDGAGLLGGAGFWDWRVAALDAHRAQWTCYYSRRAATVVVVRLDFDCDARKPGGASCTSSSSLPWWPCRRRSGPCARRRRSGMGSVRDWGRLAKALDALAQAGGHGGADGGGGDGNGGDGGGGGGGGDGSGGGGGEGDGGGGAAAA